MNNHGIFHRFGQSGKATLPYHIGAAIAVTAWGAAFINTKVLLEHGLNPVEIYIYRFIIAYLCVLVLCPKLNGMGLLQHPIFIKWKKMKLAIIFMTEKF